MTGEIPTQPVAKSAGARNITQLRQPTPDDDSGRGSMRIAACAVVCALAVLVVVVVAVLR